MVIRAGRGGAAGTTSSEQVPLDVSLRELAEVHSARIVLVQRERVVVVGRRHGAEITTGA